MAHLSDDGGGNGLGFWHRQEGREILAGHAGERQVFAVTRSLELLDNFGDLIQISFVQRPISADGKAHSMSRQRDAADQVIDRGLHRSSSVEAVIDGDLKNIEMSKVVTRPLVNRSVIRDADRRIWAARYQNTIPLEPREAPAAEYAQSARSCRPQFMILDGSPQDPTDITAGLTIQSSKSQRGIPGGRESAVRRVIISDAISRSRSGGPHNHDPFLLYGVSSSGSIR